MIKSQEMLDPNSCWNKAKDAEMLFILLGRDKAAVDTIRFWCKKRVELGKNTENDKQIIDALYCANIMEDGE